jgi:hypothetical protein
LNGWWKSVVPHPAENGGGHARFQGLQPVRRLFWSALELLPAVHIASIPIPLRFGKGDFKTGMAAASRMLWFKFEELAFDAPAMAHWREARSQEADNTDVGPKPICTTIFLTRWEIRFR